MVRLTARLPSPPVVLGLLLLLSLAGCAAGPETPRDEANPFEEAERIRQRLLEQERVARERAKILPKLLAYFGTDDAVRWREGADRLRFYERRDPGFVSDRILELLNWGLADDAQGAKARQELVRIGEILKVSAGYFSPDPDEWLRTTEALMRFGRQGVTAAAVKLIPKLGSQRIVELTKAQEGLLLLGAGAVRFLVLAIRSGRVRQNIKQRCVDVLARLGKPALPALLGCLGDPQTNVRYMGARALGAVGEKEAVPALITALNAEKNPLVACAELQALGDLGDPRAGPAIRRKIESSDLSEVKFAARAAAAIGDRQAVRALVDALGRAQDSADARVRGEILRALVKLTGKNLGPEPGPWREWVGEEK
jgi:hypothetical protein